MASKSGHLLLIFNKNKIYFIIWWLVSLSKLSTHLNRESRRRQSILPISILSNWRRYRGLKGRN